MWLLLLEMLLALLMIVFIMWWTMKGADKPHQVGKAEDNPNNKR
jgi:hypothetical protein